MSMVLLFVSACSDNSPIVKEEQTKQIEISPFSSEQNQQNTISTSNPSYSSANLSTFPPSSLEEVSAILHSFEEKLLSSSPSKNIEIDRSFEQKFHVTDTLCGLIIKSTNHQIDYKKQREELRQRQLSRIQASKNKSKKMLNATQRERIGKKASQAMDELENEMEEFEKNEVPSNRLDAMTRMIQELPEEAKPCAKDTEAIMLIEAFSPNSQSRFLSQITTNTYTCLTGLFTEKYEQIEVYGETSDPLFFSESQKECAEQN